MKCSCGHIVERKDVWICVKTQKSVCSECVPRDILIGPGKWNAIKEGMKMVEKREKYNF